MNQALGILEIRGYAPAMAALDAAEKAGDVALLQLEPADAEHACAQPGVCL